MKTEIIYSKLALKQIAKCPVIIRDKIQYWARDVRVLGIERTRAENGIGLHDEPLQGNRFGQRSIRLSRSWRLIYKVTKTDVKIITVLSVTKHDYR